MSKLVRDDNQKILQLLQPSAAHQALAVSAVSAASDALGDTTTLVELYCDTLCFVALGAAPVAEATHIPVYGGIPRTLAVTPGTKVAGILAAGTDTLRIVEMV